MDWGKRILAVSFPRSWLPFRIGAQRLPGWDHHGEIDRMASAFEHEALKDARAYAK